MGTLEFSDPRLSFTLTKLSCTFTELLLHRITVSASEEFRT